jgi:hypothetical protein
VTSFEAHDEIHVGKFGFMQVARRKVWEIDLIGCQDMTKIALQHLNRAMSIQYGKRKAQATPTVKPLVCSKYQSA